MQPSYETLSPKTLVGQKLAMSLVKNTTGELFRAFMPRRKEISQVKDQIVYDLRVYPQGYFTPFNPTTEFTKWALVEVEQIEPLPAGMEPFQLEGGTYAVFRPEHGSLDPGIFQYIFAEWLPTSGYELDDRPHFERLYPKGKRNNSDTDEEVWIPIKPTGDGT
ncbi:MAG: GyrI-like domain-containing protein [Saprospiraceae bacterium]|nr:GyrI-like domain-containing protein [Saprospiraceae bacterium]